MQSGSNCVQDYPSASSLNVKGDSLFYIKKSIVYKPDSVLHVRAYTESIIGVKPDGFVKDYRNLSYGWMDFMYLFILFFMAFTIAIYRDEMAAKFKLISSSNVSNQARRESFTIYNKSESIFAFVLYSIIFSLVIFHWFLYKRLSFADNSFLFWIQVFVGILLLGGYKSLMLWLTSFVFKEEEVVDIYSQNLNVYNHLYALLMLPAVIFITYNDYPPSLYMYLAIGYLVFIMIRTIKPLIDNYSLIKLSVFYVFLYLCTLEVVPLIIIIKVLNINV